MIRALVIGMVLGLMGYGAVVLAQSHPPSLIFGRTSGGVNVPLQVQADGTVVVQ